MNSFGECPERSQHHIELGLELGDSGELDAQLAFSIGKPLADRPQWLGGGSTSSRGGNRGS
jgi:hypothetical protein